MKHILLITLLLMGHKAWSNNLVIHEWGTFTSFMGSDGVLQGGMHIEEEPLPNFVYGIQNTQESPIVVVDRGRREPCRSKICISNTPYLDLSVPVLGSTLPVNPITEGITQKMETPVIYFYGNVGDEVSVNIKFPEGIISQYYPKAASYTPKYSDISSIGPSEFTFDVTLRDVFEDSKIPFVTDDSIWMPARNVNANTIEVGNEQEKFIFYRGVAAFDANFKVTSNLKDELKLVNNSNESITDAFVLYSDGEYGKIVKVGSISDSKKLQAPRLDNESLVFDEYVKKAKSDIAQALVDTGLYEDEALAMVNTWEKSYFHSPGLRVLYIVPNVETERILPMKISPEPYSLVRTLVGRVEIMTAKEESKYIEYLTSEENIYDYSKIFKRFHEPKLRRLLSIVLTSKISAEKKNRARNRVKSLM